MLYNRNMAGDIQINLNRFFKNPSFQGKTVGVALSGGRDSVALAYAMKMANLPMIAVNVEHGIRGENSLNDSKFVAEFCQKFDIPLLSFSVDAPAFCKENGYTLEQGARILRYEIFESVLNDKNCDYIALAHHLDDQAETVFMRIIRGTGVRGLCGMKAVSGRYIRPLLDCEREDIDEYIAKNNLEYVEDETNKDTDYTRNFLRAELEKVKKRFPSLCMSVSRLCQNASEVCDYVEQNTPDLHLENGEVNVKIEDLSDGIIAKQLVVNAAKLLGVSQDIEQRHFPLVFELCKAQNGKRIELANGIVAHKDGDCVVFERLEKGENRLKNRKEFDVLPFNIGKIEGLGVEINRVDSSKISLENLIEKAKESSSQNFGKTLYIDLGKLPDDCVVRGVKQGDFILKFGGGTKSVGDFLTDKKVPLRKREGLVVIAKDSEVFAIFGVEISKKVALDCNAKDVAELKTYEK